VLARHLVRLELLTALETSDTSLANERDVYLAIASPPLPPKVIDKQGTHLQSKLSTKLALALDPKSNV
jgi:hypothetical protein